MKDFKIRHKKVYIDNVVDLSIEELEELCDQQQIDRVVLNRSAYNNSYEERGYTVSEYKKIYTKIKEYTEGIDPEWSRTKKYVYLFRRISRGIDYDHIAAYPEEGNKEQQEYSKKNVYSCRNLKNGLIHGKCVCAGYAEILKHTCSLLDINARYVRGKAKDSAPDETHAWNIIEINDGVWIEVDPTWSHNDGLRFIGDDKESFWKSHSKSMYDNIRGKTFIDYFKMPLISNLDINGFINSELNIAEDKKYTKEDQLKIIELLERRDVYKEDVSNMIYNIVRLSEQFEQEVRYTKEELKDIGFTDSEIDNMSYAYDSRTGQKIDRKAKVRQRVIAIQQFEKEVGYTIKELKNIGLTSQQINNSLEKNYDSLTGKKINKKSVIESEIQKFSDEKQKSNEREILESVADSMIHPELINDLLDRINGSVLSLDDAIKLIEHSKDKSKWADEVYKLKFQSRYTRETRQAPVETVLKEAYKEKTLKDSDISEAVDILSQTKSEIDKTQNHQEVIEHN